MGTAKTPGQYAAAGQEFGQKYADPSGAVMMFGGLENLYSSFHKGGALDAQSYASGSGLQRASYGNYVYGVFCSAAGFTLPGTLTAASRYGYKQKLFNGAYKGRNLDLNYGGIPVDNVHDITLGYNDQRNGTTCHK
jgi:hypothetical protein